MLEVSTFSIILFDLDKFDLLLGLVLFFGFCWRGAMLGVSTFLTILVDIRQT